MSWAKPNVIKAIEEGEPSTIAFGHNLLIISGSVAGAMIVWSVASQSGRQLRMLSCLNDATQNYFKRPSPSLNFFRKHVAYAPLFAKRHNRAFKVSARLSGGSLPTRLQTSFLLAWVAINVTFVVIGIDFHAPLEEAGDVLKNRSGTLAVTNLIPLLIMVCCRTPRPFHSSPDIMLTGLDRPHGTIL